MLQGLAHGNEQEGREGAAAVSAGAEARLPSARAHASEGLTPAQLSWPVPVPATLPPATGSAGVADFSLAQALVHSRCYDADGVLAAALLTSARAWLAAGERELGLASAAARATAPLPPSIHSTLAAAFAGEAAAVAWAAAEPREAAYAAGAALGHLAQRARHAASHCALATSALSPSTPAAEAEFFTPAPTPATFTALTCCLASSLLALGNPGEAGAALATAVTALSQRGAAADPVLVSRCSLLSAAVGVALGTPSAAASALYRAAAPTLALLDEEGASAAAAAPPPPLPAMQRAQPLAARQQRHQLPLSYPALPAQTAQPSAPPQRMPPLRFLMQAQQCVRCWASCACSMALGRWHQWTFCPRALLPTCPTPQPPPLPLPCATAHCAAVRAAGAANGGGGGGRGCAGSGPGCTRAHCWGAAAPPRPCPPLPYCCSLPPAPPPTPMRSRQRVCARPARCHPPPRWAGFSVRCWPAGVVRGSERSGGCVRGAAGCGGRGQPVSTTLSSHTPHTIPPLPSPALPCHCAGAGVTCSSPPAPLHASSTVHCPFPCPAQVRSGGCCTGCPAPRPCCPGPGRAACALWGGGSARAVRGAREGAGWGSRGAGASV